MKLIHKQYNNVFKWRFAPAQLWLFETISLDEIEQIQAKKAIT